MSASDLKSDLLFYAVVSVAGYALLNKLSSGSIFPMQEEARPRIMPIETDEPATPQLPWGFREGQVFIDTGSSFLDQLKDLIRGSDETPTRESQPVYDPARDVPIMTPPDMSKIPEISRNVREYIQRHPALNAEDYFSYYPSVAWAEEFLDAIGNIRQAPAQFVSYSNQGTSMTLNPGSAPGPAGTSYYDPSIDYTNPNWRLNV